LRNPQTYEPPFARMSRFKNSFLTHCLNNYQWTVFCTFTVLFLLWYFYLQCFTYHCIVETNT
jgi:hypothetical protein